jgi:hypothetical protein
VEYRAGLDAVGQWNERAGGCYAYGDAVFEVVGKFDDDFNEHDYEDAYHVVYRINEPNPDVRYLQELYANTGGVGGYNTLSDGFIVMYPVDEYLAEIEPGLREDIATGVSEPYDVDQYLRDRRYGITHNYILHELGHMLGLQHYNHRPGVMNSEGGIARHGIEYLTDADLDAFCLNYDCL